MIFRQKKKKLEANINQVEDEIVIKQMILDNEMEATSTAAMSIATIPDAPLANVQADAKPLPFSCQLTNPLQCNCETVSKLTINRILATDFQNRIRDGRTRALCSCCTVH